MRNMKAWLYLSAAAALLLSGCGSSDSKGPAVASTSSFPFGLSSSDATDDSNNDGMDDQLSSLGFTYDAAGRVNGFRSQRQHDLSGNGIMDLSFTSNLKLNPDIPLNSQMTPFSGLPRYESRAMKAIKGPIPHEISAIVLLTQVAPVEITFESYALSSDYRATLSPPEAMVLMGRTTQTFSYNKAGRVIESSLLVEGRPYFDLAAVKIYSGAFLEKRLFTYDAQGNQTKIVTTRDDDNDGWIDSKTIFNFANSYNATGQLTQVVLTNPAETPVETITFIYDSAGNPIQTRNEWRETPEGAVTFVQQTDWTYNAAGQKLSEVAGLDIDGDGTWEDRFATAWQYDMAGRLESKEMSHGEPLSLSMTTSYDYDTAGRLTGYSMDSTATYIGGETFSYNDTGLLVGYTRTFWLGQEEAYTFYYDAQGGLEGYTRDHWGQKEVAVATVDGGQVSFTVEKYTDELLPLGKRAYDLTFLAGLPTGNLAWPADNHEVVATIPALPAWVMILDVLTNFGLK